MHCTCERQRAAKGLDGERRDAAHALVDNQSAERNCTTLIFLSLFFWNSLFFFLSEEFLAFLSAFPFFPRDFGGSPRRKNPCFFGGFPCRFPKKQGKEDQGKCLDVKMENDHSSPRNLWGFPAVSSYPLALLIRCFPAKQSSLLFTQLILQPLRHCIESPSV